MSMLEPWPGEGIHKNVTSGVYHSWGGASNSRLSNFEDTPAYARYQIENPQEPTKPMILGNRVHSAYFEPDIFNEQHLIEPKCKKSSKEDKATWAEFEELLKSSGKEGISEKDFEEVNLIVGALGAHPDVRALKEYFEDVELSLAWKDAECGIPCKARLDAYSASTETIFDLKTTSDAAEGKFSKAIFDFGYHRQAAFYLDAATHLAIPAKYFIHIVVETKPPYQIQCFRLSDEVINFGREQVRGFLKMFAACIQTEKWPSYPLGLKTINLPTYLNKQG